MKKISLSAAASFPSDCKCHTTIFSSSCSGAAPLRCRDQLATEHRALQAELAAAGEKVVTFEEEIVRQVGRVSFPSHIAMTLSCLTAGNETCSDVPGVPGSSVSKDR